MDVKCSILSFIVGVFLLCMVYPIIFGTHGMVFECNGTKDKPCVVFDTPSSESKPVALRDSLMMASAYQGNINGLKALWISGSAIPSQRGWQSIREFIHQQTHHQVANIVVVDLRQESHGYLNGRAVTLVDTHDWINVGKSDSEVNHDEQGFLNQLQSAKEGINVLTPKQFKTKAFVAGESIVVTRVQTEEEMVRALGYQYHRINVTDHLTPLDNAVDAFVLLVDRLPKNTWLHVHCRGGKGRTTTFLTLFDMLYNANKVSFKDIIQRQASVPPFYNLGQVSRLNKTLTPYYQARLVFLSRFYRYAQYKLMGYNKPWSIWNKEN